MVQNSQTHLLSILEQINMDIFLKTITIVQQLLDNANGAKENVEKVECQQSKRL